MRSHAGEHAPDAAPTPAVASGGPGTTSGAGATGVTVARVLALQKSAGNTAVTALLQRQHPPMDAGVGGMDAGVAAPPRESPRQQIDHALSDRSPARVLAVSDFGPATDAERLTLIEIMLGGAPQLDHSGAETVRRIWQSFGTNLARAASDHSDLWDRCNAQGAALPQAWLGAGAGHVDRNYSEEVGSLTFVGTEGYDYRITATEIHVRVPINFVSDPGVTPPVPTWFGFITSTWNKFTAVDQTNPSQRRRIVFEPTTGGTMHNVRVHAGNRRADAGNWYVGAPDMASVAGHEFGHFIGLEDEYERRHADYTRVVGSAPEGGTSDEEQVRLARRIANDMHAALFQAEGTFELHQTAVDRRVGAVTRVFDAHRLPRNYSTPLTRQVTTEYRTLFRSEIVDDIQQQIDESGTERNYQVWLGATPIGNFREWREGIAGAFEYTSTSLMGQSALAAPGSIDHEHPVQPRHVRKFATYVQQFLRSGNWQPVEDH